MSTAASGSERGFYVRTVLVSFVLVIAALFLIAFVGWLLGPTGGGRTERTGGSTPCSTLGQVTEGARGSTICTYSKN